MDLASNLEHLSNLETQFYENYFLNNFKILTSKFIYIFYFSIRIINYKVLLNGLPLNKQFKNSYGKNVISVTKILMNIYYIF